MSSQIWGVTATNVRHQVAATVLMSSQIWGVTATDPWTFGSVALILAAVGAVACLLPVRRATRVDPLVALRNE